MTRERTLSAVGTGEVSARELGNSAAARSREVAEQLWVAVCRGIRAGHQQRPAFVFPERTAVMSSSRCTTQWSLVVVLGLGLATSVTAQEPDRSSRGVYNFPKTSTVRSGVVQKVNPGGAKPDIVVTDLSLNGVPAAPAVTVSSDQAGWTAGGRCLFALGYHLKNVGAAPTQSALPSFVTEVAVAGPAPSSKFQSGFALDVGQVQSGQMPVWLVPGVQTATVFADPNDTIPEQSESNNRRSVRVTLTGKCDGKTPIVQPLRQQGYEGLSPIGAEGGDLSKQR
jgi:hypothetical protein